jgi:hypothetical protein
MSFPIKAGVFIHPSLCPSLRLIKHKNNLKQFSQPQEIKFMKLNVPKQKTSIGIAFFFLLNLQRTEMECLSPFLLRFVLDL